MARATTKITNRKEAKAIVALKIGGLSSYIIRSRVFRCLQVGQIAT